MALLVRFAPELGQWLAQNLDRGQAPQALIGTMRDQAVNDFGLEGTPTFYINGKQLTGEKTLDQLSAEIDPLL